MKEYKRSDILIDYYVAKYNYEYFSEFGFLSEGCFALENDLKPNKDLCTEIIPEIFNELFKDTIEGYVPIYFIISPVCNSITYLNFKSMKCCTKRINKSDYYEYLKQVELLKEEQRDDVLNPPSKSEIDAFMEEIKKYPIDAVAELEKTLVESLSNAREKYSNEKRFEALNRHRDCIHIIGDSAFTPLTQHIKCTTFEDIADAIIQHEEFLKAYDIKFDTFNTSNLYKKRKEVYFKENRMLTELETKIELEKDEKYQKMIDEMYENL